MWILLALALSQDPQPPAVTTGSDSSSALRFQFTGHLDLHYLNRSGEIDAAGSVLNDTVPPVDGSKNFWAGRISLRADVELKDFVSGVLELENRSFENGMNRPFGTHPTQSTVFIKQGYINVDDFLLSKFGVRIGVQDVTFRNRPQDEPFFMDLGESEGFYRGFRPAEALITNTVDRDITEPVGVRLFYSPFEIMTLQAFWMVVGEGGGTPHDESVYGLVANSLLGEDWSAWLMFVAVSGGEGGLGTIETFGLGLDGFFFDDKAVEVFVEGYAQTGTLRHAPAAIHKSAYAYSLGARYLGFFNRKLWLEVAYSRRSGDRRIGDDHDSAFQSYENVNRFLILESSEFGLDVDTNISSTRLTVGVGPFDVSGRPFRVQLDVGRFAAATQVVGPIGVIEGRMWGIESDLSFIYDYNSSLSFKLKGALLGDSSLLKQLVNENHAWMIVFGADLNF